MKTFLCGKLFGHKTQFDKRPNTVRQKPVIDLVHVRKIVNRLTIRFIVDTNFIVENRMETHVFKSGRFFDESQVPAIVVAQGQNGPPRAKHTLPIMGEWMTSSRRVYFNDFCSELSGCSIRNTRESKRASEACRPPDW